MRVVVVTGKGGVGKTTVAAATAIAAARRGERTLVMSTDPAHSLADSFDVSLGDDPVEVSPACWATQLDAQARMTDSWSEIRDYLRRLFDWAGVDDLRAEELAVLPGLDELFALGDVADAARSGRYDVVVVDCAPTAETIRLLSLPDVLGWYVERLFPIGRRVTKVVGPVVSRLASGLPMADDGVFRATERLHERLAEVHDLLSDPQVASVRIVTTAERMVVAEARRLATYVALFGYHVDAVVANRLLPETVDDPWFAEWRRTQGEQLRAVEEGFAPVPVLRLPLAPAEVVGVDALRRVAESLYDGVDPTAVLHRGRPFEVRKATGDDADVWELVLPLPQARRDEVDLARVDDELVVTVGPYRRAMVLPDTLRRSAVTGARLVDGDLVVRFGPRDATPAGT